MNEYCDKENELEEVITKVKREFVGQDVAIELIKKQDRKL